MMSWLAFTALLLLFTVLLVILWLLLRQSREQQRQYHLLLRQQSQQESRRVETLLTSSRQLLDKALGLVATNDPLAFQAIQAMTQASGYDEPEYDPSDDAEFQRLKDMGRVNEGDGLNGEELDILSDVASVAPELFGPNGTPV